MGFFDSDVFSGISKSEYLEILKCFAAVTKVYKKGEIIYDYTEGNGKIGIIQSGTAVIERIDVSGNKSVLENLATNSVFGEMFTFSTSSVDSVMVVCEKNCKVMFIGYDHILKRCERACRHHSVIVENVLHLVAEKARMLSERIEVLTHKSIRGKLMCYFRLLSTKQGTDIVILPFSLSKLSEYISADRSAMMRELKNMKNEQLIMVNDKTVTLLGCCTQIAAFPY